MGKSTSPDGAGLDMPAIPKKSKEEEEEEDRLEYLFSDEKTYINIYYGAMEDLVLPLTEKDCPRTLDEFFFARVESIVAKGSVRKIYKKIGSSLFNDERCLLGLQRRRKNPNIDATVPFIDWQGLYGPLGRRYDIGMLQRQCIFGCGAFDHAIQCAVFSLETVQKRFIGIKGSRNRSDVWKMRTETEDFSFLDYTKPKSLVVACFVKSVTDYLHHRCVVEKDVFVLKFRSKSQRKRRLLQQQQDGEGGGEGEEGPDDEYDSGEPTIDDDYSEPSIDVHGTSFGGGGRETTDFTDFVSMRGDKRCFRIYDLKHNLMFPTVYGFYKYHVYPYHVSVHPKSHYFNASDTSPPPPPPPPSSSSSERQRDKKRARPTDVSSVDRRWEKNALPPFSVEKLFSDDDASVMAKHLETVMECGMGTDVSPSKPLLDEAKLDSFLYADFRRIGSSREGYASAEEVKCRSAFYGGVKTLCRQALEALFPRRYPSDTTTTTTTTTSSIPTRKEVDPVTGVTNFKVELCTFPFTVRTDKRLFSVSHVRKEGLAWILDFASKEIPPSSRGKPMDAEEKSTYLLEEFLYRLFAVVIECDTVRIEKTPPSSLFDVVTASELGRRVAKSSTTAPIAWKHRWKGESKYCSVDNLVDFFTTVFELESLDKNLLFRVSCDALESKGLLWKKTIVSAKAFGVAHRISRGDVILRVLEAKRRPRGDGAYPIYETIADPTIEENDEDDDDEEEEEEEEEDEIDVESGEGDGIGNNNNNEDDPDDDAKMEKERQEMYCGILMDSPFFMNDVEYFTVGGNWKALNILLETEGYEPSVDDPIWG